MGTLQRLIARKTSGPEKSALDGDDAGPEFHSREYDRLRGVLEASCRSSALPEGPSSRPALNDLLIRLGLG